MIVIVLVIVGNDLLTKFGNWIFLLRNVEPRIYHSKADGNFSSLIPHAIYNLPYTKVSFLKLSTFTKGKAYRIKFNLRVKYYASYFLCIL